MQESLKASTDGTACRDAAIHDLQAQLARAHASFEEHLAAKDALLLQKEAQLAQVAGKEAQLAAAQARLAQVAPIMRRIASRATAVA